jgi:hypothetical protein
MEQAGTTIQPVFVVGTPKSGTSLLWALFDSHPAVLGLLETNVYRLGDSRTSADLASYLNSLVRRPEPIHPAFTQDSDVASVRARIKAQRSLRLPQELLCAFVQIGIRSTHGHTSPKITHLIEKTPHHFLCAEAILADFPDARIIHMLRDPRDNYLSLKRRMRHPHHPLFRHPRYHPILFLENRLLASLEAAYENVTKFGERYRVLFYEDLIQAPEAVMRAIASWVGLPWDERLLLPSIHGEPWRGNSLSPDLQGKLHPFDSRPIGRWQSELSDREIRLLEHIIRCYALEKKYHPIKNFNPLLHIADLFTPFHNEILLEFKNLKNQKDLLISFLLLGRRYFKRRTTVYFLLQKRLSNLDDRLISHSFSSYESQLSLR